MRDSLYLLRFDDICPTMNWANWDPVEAQLAGLGLRPILAVVPDNRDPRRVAGPPRADFWPRVRQWQAQGWAIALHGYQHLYVNRNPGIIGLNPQSEFAGLPRREQEDKLRKGLAIFRDQGVRAEAWVAPAHSFDRTTVDLLVELGIEVISDGLWHRPFSEPGRVTWVPQQVWEFCPRPAGVWTVCCHPNPWSPDQLERFQRTLAAYAPRVTDLGSILDCYGGRRPSLGDRLTGWYESAWTHGLRPRLARGVREVRS
jgi:peptidoglycan/xylan/chitin deacetylase (PgdA/CDA1 family)